MKSIFTSAEAHAALALEAKSKVICCRKCGCKLVLITPDAKVTSFFNLICRQCRHFMRYRPFAEKALQKTE